jgi:hypothetical protein
VNVALLAHEGHQHGPDLGLVALLVAVAVLLAVLGAGAARRRITARTRRPPRA